MASTFALSRRSLFFIPPSIIDGFHFLTLRIVFQKVHQRVGGVCAQSIGNDFQRVGHCHACAFASVVDC